MIADKFKVAMGIDTDAAIEHYGKNKMLIGGKKKDGRYYLVFSDGSLFFYLNGENKTVNGIKDLMSSGITKDELMKLILDSEKYKDVFENSSLEKTSLAEKVGRMVLLLPDFKKAAEFIKKMKGVPIDDEALKEENYYAYFLFQDLSFLRFNKDKTGYESVNDLTHTQGILDMLFIEKKYSKIECTDSCIAYSVHKMGTVLEDPEVIADPARYLNTFNDNIIVAVYADNSMCVINDNQSIRFYEPEKAENRLRKIIYDYLTEETSQC